MGRSAACLARRRDGLRSLAETLALRPWLRSKTRPSAEFLYFPNGYAGFGRGIWRNLRSCARLRLVRPDRKQGALLGGFEAAGRDFSHYENRSQRQQRPFREGL